MLSWSGCHSVEDYDRHDDRDQVLHDHFFRLIHHTPSMPKLSFKNHGSSLQQFTPCWKSSSMHIHLVGTRTPTRSEPLWVERLSHRTNWFGPHRHVALMFDVSLKTNPVRLMAKAFDSVIHPEFVFLFRRHGYALWMFSNERGTSGYFNVHGFSASTTQQKQRMNTWVTTQSRYYRTEHIHP